MLVYAVLLNTPEHATIQLVGESGELTVVEVLRRPRKLQPSANWPAIDLKTPSDKKFLENFDLTFSPPASCDHLDHVLPAKSFFVHKTQPFKSRLLGHIAYVCVGTERLIVEVVPAAEAVVLNWNDAADLGYKPNRMSFDETVNIAGRQIRATKTVVIPVLYLGSTKFTNVDARIVRDGEIDASIIGQTLLRRFKGTFVDKDNKLVMNYR
jgi:clan AA aspartic protease (TIGR02281 family)